MKKLLDGIVLFRKGDFDLHKDLFSSLKRQQKPHTLFISCSDSRVDPNLITRTLPGELFIIRNIANLVPPYRATADYVSTTSAIEYAVLELNVENIIICGHSNCGGCDAGLNLPDTLMKMPHTRKWLELARPAREKVLRTMKREEPEALEWMMEQYNVIEQLRNLWSYPYIRERVTSGNLHLSGWYYIIETGEVFIYNPEQGAFLLGNG